MKKNTLLLFAIFSFFIIQSQCIDYVHIPDANFKEMLLADVLINTNGDNEISCTEASSFNGVINLQSHSINDLTGIEYFENITELDCFLVGLTSLDVSNNTELIDLDCRGNNLTSLNVSNNVELLNLKCSSNDLTSLDISNNTALTYLNCANNNLTSLNVSNNTALKTLTFNGNYIENIDVSNNLVLERMACYENEFISLDVSNNVALLTLSCSINNLISLDVSNNIALANLFCSENNLTSLDVSSNINLGYLTCFNNDLFSLNVANGNNEEGLGVNFFAQNNPNLSCVQVDDVDFSNTNWIENVDEGVSFSTNCENTLSIRDNEFSKSVSVYPNPVTNNLQISFNGEDDFYRVQVYNLLGEEVLNSSSNILDTSVLPVGMYLVKITNTQGELGVRKLEKR